MQNTAARILNKKKYHITPVLISLPWLPVRARSDFNNLLLTYKILHRLAPSYLSTLITRHIPAGAVRSQNAGLPSLSKINKTSVPNPSSLVFDSFGGKLKNASFLISIQPQLVVSKYCHLTLT